MESKQEENSRLREELRWSWALTQDDEPGQVRIAYYAQAEESVDYHNSTGSTQASPPAHLEVWS